MIAPLTVEATGETVGEAKWSALRELELLVPRLDRSAVRFQVLSEGERGLLGVGSTPARVLATAAVAATATVAGPAEESEAARRVRDVLMRVAAALGIRCRVEIEEDGPLLTATCSGEELGLLIGRHGQTIDAVQTLSGAIASRGGEIRRDVVVDAAGYRERRRRALEGLAVRVADEAARSGERQALEPMSPPERKIVHAYLQDREDVRTESEGNEPGRYVVVAPR